VSLFDWFKRKRKKPKPKPENEGASVFDKLKEWAINWLAGLLGIDKGLMQSIIAFIEMLIGQLGSKKAAKDWIDKACKADVAKLKKVVS